MNQYIRKICDFWEHYEPRFVKINKNRIRVLAEQLRQAKPKIPDWQTPELPSASRAFVSHIFYICAIDFAFTHFNPPYHSFSLSPAISGSSAASMCFLRHFGNYEISAEEMLDITANEKRLKKIFKGSKSPGGQTNWPPLIKERGVCLTETAKVLMEHFNGNVFSLLKQSQYETRKLISNLIQYFPTAFGADHYNGLYINKRAQLFPLIYHGRALHSSGVLRPLKNPDDIGPIPDYQIPKYLRAIDVLKYAKSLDKKIANRQILPFGSTEEREIRIATVYAVCELMKLTNLTMPTLDYFLWQGGQKIQYLNHHLTPTTAY